MKRSHLALGFITSAFLISIAAASGWVVPHPPPPGPHPGGTPAEPQARLGPIELRHHQVEARIDDQIATSRVEQVFYNPTSRPIEGTYYFPIPHEAQIDRFSMFIDDKEVEGELLDAKKAREIYEGIVRQMKDPALLEFAGQGLFRVRVFPFEPQSERRIRLQYTELLPKDGDLVSYALPLRAGGSHSGRKTPLYSLKLELASKLPIKTLYSPTHDIEITRPDEHRATIGFESSSPSAETDFKLFFAPDPKVDDIGMTLLTHRPSESEDGYFMLLASPRVQVDESQVIAKDVVFVLDTSGSMSGGKLEQAKRALHFCLDNLNDADRFEIIRFSTEAEPVFSRLVQRSTDNLKEARTFIDGLRPIGGTAIDAALQMAVRHIAERDEQERPYMVIFLTDGRPTVGLTGEDAILKNLEQTMADADSKGVRIFSFGIGSDVNTYLLDRLSQQSRAVSEYVLADEDIEIKVSRFYSKITDPVLANLDLSIEGAGRITRVHPAADNLPDLFKGDQLVVTGRYSGDGEARITLKGKVLGEERAFTMKGAFSEQATEHEFVPRLWAARRIGFLLDEIRQRGENKELLDEVAQLARTHGIVTPYTAYLILEDEERRGVPEVARSIQGGGFGGGRGGGAPAARRAYEDMARERTGDSAVAASQSNTRMQTAWNMGQMIEANTYAMRGSGGAVAQQARVVRGRAFVQNGPVWIDSNIQAAPEANRVQIAFDSDGYYELLDRHPDAAAWFSLGRNVQVLLGDTVYEVIEE